MVTILCLLSSIFVGNQSAYLREEDNSINMKEHNEVNRREGVMEMKRIPTEADYLRIGLNNNGRDEVNVKKRGNLIFLGKAPRWNHYLLAMRSEPKTRNYPDYPPVTPLRPSNVVKRYYLRVMRKRDSKDNNLVNYVSIQ